MYICSPCYYCCRSHVLQKVCIYFTYKVRFTNSSTEIPEFPIAPEVALELLMAANFLDCWKSRYNLQQNVDMTVMTVTTYLSAYILHGFYCYDSMQHERKAYYGTLEGYWGQSILGKLTCNTLLIMFLFILEQSTDYYSFISLVLCFLNNKQEILYQFYYARSCSNFSRGDGYIVVIYGKYIYSISQLNTNKYIHILPFWFWLMTRSFFNKVLDSFSAFFGYHVCVILCLYLLPFLHWSQQSIYHVRHNSSTLLLYSTLILLHYFNLLHITLFIN